MAVIISRQPPEIDFTGNDIYFRVKGNSYANDITTSSCVSLLKDNRSVSIGTIGSAHTTSANPITAGQKMVISFNDISVEISFVLSPDESGNQIGINRTMQQIVEDLKQNYFLNKYYIITGSDQYLIFTSREKPGIAPIIDLSNCPSFRFANSTTGAPYLVRGKQYKVYSSLYIQSGVDSYSLVNEMFNDVNNVGLTEIVISGILKKLFDQHVLPTIYRSTPYISFVAKKYYMEFAESFEKNIRKLQKSTVRYAIPGKIPNLNHASYNYQSWLLSNARFLTNITYKIFTTYRAEQYLYFLADKDRLSLTVYADIIFTDESATRKTLFSIASVKKGEVLCIPAGVMHSGVHTINKVVKEYTISLFMRNSNIVSFESINTLEKVLSKAQFEVGQEPTDVLYFSFENHLHVFETLVAQRPRSEVSTKRTTIDKYALDGYNSENIIEDTSVVYEAVTIPLTPDEQVHFVEFLESDNIYLTLGRRRYKISLEAGTYENMNTAKTIQAVKFKYHLDIAGEAIDESRAYDNTSHSWIQNIREISTEVNAQLPIDRNVEIVNDTYVNTNSNTSSDTTLPQHIIQIANMLKLGHVRGGGNVTIDAFGRMWSQATDLAGSINQKLIGLTVAEQLTSILSTDSILTAFGKIQKYLSSLKALAFKDKVNWNSDIDNIPGTFPPSAHAHVWLDITDKPLLFPPSAHIHQWVDIANKPTEFTPSAHIHNSRIESSESSGIIFVLSNQKKVLTTTLTSTNSITITPSLPTSMAEDSDCEIYFNTGETAPNIIFTAPSGVTIEWKIAYPSSIKANAKYNFFFSYVTSTRVDGYWEAK